MTKQILDEWDCIWTRVIDPLDDYTVEIAIIIVDGKIQIGEMYGDEFIAWTNSVVVHRDDYLQAFDLAREQAYKHLKETMLYEEKTIHSIMRELEYFKQKILTRLIKND